MVGELDQAAQIDFIAQVLLSDFVSLSPQRLEMFVVAFAQPGDQLSMVHVIVIRVFLASGPFEPRRCSARHAVLAVSA